MSDDHFRAPTAGKTMMAVESTLLLVCNVCLKLDRCALMAFKRLRQPMLDNPHYGSSMKIAMYTSQCPLLLFVHSSTWNLFQVRSLIACTSNLRRPWPSSGACCLILVGSHLLLGHLLLTVAAKSFVMAMLYIARPLPITDLETWVRPGSQRYPAAACCTETAT